MVDIACDESDQIVVTQGLLVAWVTAAFREGALSHASVAQPRLSALSEQLRRLEDDAEFIRDSAAKRIMEAEQKAKAAQTSAAAEAAAEQTAREEELASAKSRAETLSQQLEQVSPATRVSTPRHAIFLLYDAH